jgi:outer membrane lipoprotein LolB
LRVAKRATLCALVGAALLVGCASPTPPVGPASPTDLREWSGRFAVSLKPDGADSREEGGGGRFMLTRTASEPKASLELQLLSPFGQVMASGRRRPDGRATLTLANGSMLQAASLDAVIEQALGWSLPVERLTDWLDDRFEDVISRDAQGQVMSARDSGWFIRREPRRWELERSQPTGRLRVILVLDR